MSKTIRRSLQEIIDDPEIDRLLEDMHQRAYKEQMTREAMLWNRRQFGSIP